MFILLQGIGDPMVLDSVRGHEATRRALDAFLVSPHVEVEFDCRTPCPTYPGFTTLLTFRMVKTAGPILTRQLPGRVLQVSGRPELLARYVEAFAFEPSQDGEHHHPEQKFMGELDPASEMIIVEADDELEDLVR